MDVCCVNCIYSSGIPIFDPAELFGRGTRGSKIQYGNKADAGVL